MKRLKIFEKNTVLKNAQHLGDSNRKTQTVYISGQITGLKLEEARAKFNEAEALLSEKGYTVVNPMKLNPHADEKTWKEYIGLLMDCDGIYLLDNWQQSKGARIEYQVAKEMGITVVTKL